MGTPRTRNIITAVPAIGFLKTPHLYKDSNANDSKILNKVAIIFVMLLTSSPADYGDSFVSLEVIMVVVNPFFRNKPEERLRLEKSPVPRVLKGRMIAYFLEYLSPNSKLLCQKMRGLLYLL